MSRIFDKLREKAFSKLYEYTYSTKRVFLPIRKIQLQVNKAGPSRSSWESTFLSLWEPLAHLFSPGKAAITIDGPRVSRSGKASDGYEAFARSFIGVAFYLHHKADSTVTLSSGEKVDLAAIYREGIINGTDPGHKEFWGKIRSSQKLAENCSIAIGLLLTRRHIWDRLSPAEKEQVATWFQANAILDYPVSNWQWFKAFHYLFLEKTGFAYDTADLEKTLGNIDKMYCGDGWYSDGLPENGPRFDYYVPWAMVFYSLIFCYLAEDTHKERQRIYLERAKRFSLDYQHYFTPHGHPPPYGRSQLYRFASLAPWGISLLLDCSGADLAWVKKSAIDTLNAFLEKGAVREDGILGMGYYKEFTPMLEAYSGPGSPYWAFKGFSFLLLPEDHAFWSQDVAQITPRELIHPIETIKMTLLHSGDSHIVLLNAGANTEYPLKYDKFAYSNTFLMDYSLRDPVDNAMILRSKNGAWEHRRTFLDTACSGNICSSRWQLKDTTVQSILLGTRDGYIAIHRLISGSLTSFRTGGFPLSQDDRMITTDITGGGVVLRGEKGEVCIRLLSGTASPYITHSRGINPAGKYSFVPCLKGAFSRNERTVVLAVWATMAPGTFEVPRVTLHKQTCTVTWRDREQKINLDI